MSQTRILMCPPEHFEVDYVINPWMEGQTAEVDRQLAMDQWRRLRDAIGEHAEIVEMPAVAGQPDLVFTANAAVVHRDVAVPSRFHHEERRGEEPHYTAFLKELGFTIHELPRGISFEGAGDGLLYRDEPWLFAGWGFRTDRESHVYLDRWFEELEILPLRLVDPHYYHIDTCFCPLSGGWLMYHPQAFDQATRELIEQRVPEDKRIQVDAEDASHFACNAVNVAQEVFLNRASDGLKDALGAAGFRVHECALTEFLKAGGSAKCLTLKLDEPEA